MIPDTPYREIKRRAALRRRSISDLTTEPLQAGMRPAPPIRHGLPPLPTFDMGSARVDVADRDALERTMDKRP